MVWEGGEVLLRDLLKGIFGWFGHFERNTRHSGIAARDDRKEKLARGLRIKIFISLAVCVFGSLHAVWYFCLREGEELDLLKAGIIAMIGAGAFSMDVMGSIISFRRKSRIRPDSEHGTSSIMTEKELPEFQRYFFYDPAVVRKYFKKLRTEYDDMELKTVCRKGYGQWAKMLRSRRLFRECFLSSQIMGQGVYLSMNCKFINRNLNTLTIGGSGQGKSYSELLPNALNGNCNYVFTDPSGEILQKVGKFLLGKKYKIRVFNVEEFGRSQRYNPLAYVSSEKDYNTLVDALNKNIKPDKKGGGPNEFFDDAKDSLICALVALLKELYPDSPERQTLANVMELLRLSPLPPGGRTGRFFQCRDQ